VSGKHVDGGNLALAEMELTGADSAGKPLAISQAKGQEIIKANLITGPVAR